MKNGFLLILGVAGALAVSFAALVLWSISQLNALPSYYDDTDSQAYPAGQTGFANAGALVYRDLGCAACHTQAVRRPGFGSDDARGWGDRQSVARDYIFKPIVQLGQSRIGPDLANLGGRQPAPPTEEKLYELLCDGKGGMPAFPFLFRERGPDDQPSDIGLEISSAAGRQIVPTRRAQELVAYLLSLNSPYVYPEARPAPAQAAGKEEKR